MYSHYFDPSPYPDKWKGVVRKGVHCKNPCQIKYADTSSVVELREPPKVPIHQIGTFGGSASAQLCFDLCYSCQY